MANKVFYDDDARRRVLAGAETLYKAVKTTMGPKGRNVVLSKAYGAPSVTHDGVTVAKGIELADSVDDETLGYRAGAELIKQAASKMNDVAGDGTTTVTVLTYHILNEANKLIAAGYNPMLLRKGLDIAGSFVADQVQFLSESVEGKNDKIAQVATISAGSDEIGNLIAEVIGTIGKEGVVAVEPGQGLRLESEVVEGFTFDRGFVSPYMVTDAQRMEARYDNIAVVVTDKRVLNIAELLPLLEKLSVAGKKNVMLIAEDVEGEALGTLVLNKMRGTFNTIAVKAPSWGDQRKHMLDDIAALTGATVISADKGMGFDTVDLSVVGHARKVIVDATETTIIEGGGRPSEIKAQLDSINNGIEHATSEYDKEQLEKRRASIQGKVAVIRVGGATETEIEEKKYRVDDAVAAVKAALAEGIVPGGGVTLIKLALLLAKTSVEGDDETVEAGKQLLVKALDQPFHILMENSGLVSHEWLKDIKASKNYGLGVDVTKPDKLIDLKKAGVIDPARVTKEAVLNAVSIAGTAITMGALVVEVPKAEPAQQNLQQV